MPEATAHPPSQATLTLDCADWLTRAAGLAGPAAAALAVQLLEHLDDMNVPTAATVTVPLPAIPQPAASAGIAPAAVLSLLAGAIRDAEASLGAQNLAVHAGQLEALFSVGGGENGIATARVSLRVAPKPLS
jgi:hypothetical protein